jgi:branched-chain amino acid transport system substrate-binding protein
MAEAPIDDALFGPTTIRKDGRAVHDMFLFQVKMPAERKARWDYYKVAATIPAAEAVPRSRTAGARSSARQAGFRLPFCALGSRSLQVRS